MQSTTPHLTDPAGITSSVTPACIVLIHGGPLGRRVELTGHDLTISRDDDNAVSVPLHTVSRRHARIFSDGARHCVEGLESTNGTFVNKVEVRREELLARWGGEELRWCSRRRRSTARRSLPSGFGTSS